MTEAASGAGLPGISDRRAVRALLGRESVSHHTVALRCPYGGPAVLENTPRDAEGRPFPTRYWLACRAVARAVARLEASGGVRELETSDALDDALADAQRRHAELHDGHYIAGVGDPRHVKCLHAHLAFGMVQGGIIGEWIWERAEAQWPERCCVEPLVGEPE
jgi:hypothetical protein